MFFLFRNLETESATPAAYAAKEPCLGVQRDLLSQAKSPSTDRSHQRLGGGGEGDLINRHYDDDVMWGVRLLRLVWWLGIVVGVPYLSSLDEVFPRMHTCSFFFFNDHTSLSFPRMHIYSLFPYMMEIFSYLN